MWLPVWSEWLEPRRALVREACAGLRAAEVEARIDRHCEDPHCIELLRVRTPFAAVEESEDWLLRNVQPYDDADVEWAGNVALMLVKRWPEYGVWSGAADDPFLARLDRLPPVRRARFVMTYHGTEGRGVLAYPRGLTEVVRCLPDVRIDGPTEVERPQEWVAIDKAFEAADLQTLRAFEHGLQARGFATCRYEWNGTRGVEGALTVHAGRDTLDRFEARLAIALQDESAAWRARYQPWSWTTGVSIHVATAPSCWRLREWLEARLGGAYVDAQPLERDWPIGGVLKVGATYVDRALDLLREHGQRAGDARLL